MERNAAMQRNRRLRKALARGVTLIEVLIVVAIMAMLSAGVAFGVMPKFKESRIKSAITGAQTIRKAAELYQATSDSDKCPTVQDLVSSKNLDGTHTEDPWGKPYKIVCEDGDVHVISGGNDKKEGTEDDVKDSFKMSDVAKLMEK
jgi:general secretion pathway protein G